MLLPLDLYPFFFHTFGSSPKNARSLVAMPRCLFPASHNLSLPHGQWYPPQSLQLMHGTGRHPEPMGLRLPWEWMGVWRGYRGSSTCPCASVLVCTPLMDWWLTPGSSQAGSYLGSLTCLLALCIVLWGCRWAFITYPNTTNSKYRMIWCRKAQECLFSGFVDIKAFVVQEIHYAQIYVRWSLTTNFIT